MDKNIPNKRPSLRFFCRSHWLGILATSWGFHMLEEWSGFSQKEWDAVFSFCPFFLPSFFRSPFLSSCVCFCFYFLCFPFFFLSSECISSYSFLSLSLPFFMKGGPSAVSCGPRVIRIVFVLFCLFYYLILSENPHNFNQNLKMFSSPTKTKQNKTRQNKANRTIRIIAQFKLTVYEAPIRIKRGTTVPFFSGLSMCHRSV